ncbi:MAG: pantoate--beta-alanine ligase [Gammaproteobacteria bacterium]|nr:pantoate--beta-alanine ligase [Gammaproteobacteria bacterium]
MKIITSAVELQAARRAWTGDVGFVPTMGGLHRGHAALFAHARTRHRHVVASVYVNPLQFGPREDFSAYPRTFEADQALLEASGVDIAFFPTPDAIYPAGPARQTEVRVPGLSDDLCGRYRPGHFTGVTTVVARLFGLVQPTVAYFGKKDYQQWRLIEQMVRDLAWSIAVIGVDTVREADGLALSTRNRYLNADQRARAPLLAELLRTAAVAIQAGDDIPAVERTVLEQLRGAGFVPDYVSVRRQSDLGLPQETDDALVILAAAHLGEARLIDNREFSRLGLAESAALHEAEKAG